MVLVNPLSWIFAGQKNSIKPPEQLEDEIAMNPQEEVNRLREWLSTFSECACEKRLFPGKEVQWEIPECWDRKNLPPSWYDLCSACRSELALTTKTYPSQTGHIYQPKEEPHISIPNPQNEGN